MVANTSVCKTDIRRFESCSRLLQGIGAMVSAEVLYTYGFRFESEARGAVFKDYHILQKPDNKYFAFIRLYFMLFGFVKDCL